MSKKVLIAAAADEVDEMGENLFEYNFDNIMSKICLGYLWKSHCLAKDGRDLLYSQFGIGVANETDAFFALGKSVRKESTPEDSPLQVLQLCALELFEEAGHPFMKDRLSSKWMSTHLEDVEHAIQAVTSGIDISDPESFPTPVPVWWYQATTGAGRSSYRKHLCLHLLQEIAEDEGYARIIWVPGRYDFQIDFVGGGGVFVKVVDTQRAYEARQKVPFLATILIKEKLSADEIRDDILKKVREKKLESKKRS